MSENNVAAHQQQQSSFVENWPNLMFLGLGVWWAWTWLCFTSVEITKLFPAELQSQYVLYMYAASTLAIIACMLIGVAAWRRLTPLLDRRGVIIAFGALASVATIVACMSGYLASTALFVVAACVTGVGTSSLCLKAGRVYGSVTLTESLAAGSISMLFAALLYFVGIGIPKPFSPLFIAALPLLAAAIISLPWSDPYPAAIHGTSERLPFNAPERVMVRKITVAMCVVAFTAGVGKGVSSLANGTDSFSLSGVTAVFFIGVVATLLIYLISRARSAHGVRMIYTLLMVAGILEMLATCFGFNIFYLEVGKTALWLMFWCFSAYLVFKFDLSSVRTFGLLQAAYYISSLLGWGVGAALAPQYASNLTVQTATGVLLACLVIGVLLFVLTESDIKHIVEWSHESNPAELAQGVAVNVPVARSVAEVASTAVSNSEEAESVEDMPERTGDENHPAATDNLQRARDPKYGLSKREFEILELFARGRSANWIADSLYISKNTVRTHLRNIYTKLDVHTRQELLDFLTGKKQD